MPRTTPVIYVVRGRLPQKMSNHSAFWGKIVYGALFLMYHNFVESSVCKYNIRRCFAQFARNDLSVVKFLNHSGRIWRQLFSLQFAVPESLMRYPAELRLLLQ